MRISRMIGLIDIVNIDGLYPKYKTLYTEQGIKDYGYFKYNYIPGYENFSDWKIRIPKYFGIFEYFDQCIVQKKINGEMREVVVSRDAIIFKNMEYKDIWQGVFNE